MRMTQSIFLLTVFVLAALAEWGVAQEPTYTFKLYPYNEELAERMNEYVSDSSLRFEEDPERNEFYMGTLRWKKTERFAFWDPGDYSLKEPWGAGSEEDGEEQGYQSDPVPFQTKKHRMYRMRGGEHERPIGEDDGEVPEEATEKEEGFLSRLFGSDEEPTEEGVLSQEEENQSNAVPYDTKKRVTRKFEGPRGVKPRHDGSPVVIAGSAPKLNRSVLPQVNNEIRDNQPKASPPKAPPPKAQVELESRPEFEVPANSPDKLRTQMVQARPQSRRGNRTLLAQFLDTLNPFSNSTEYSYTIMAHWVLPTGRELSLPDVKSRDERELERMFAQLSAQSALWIHQEKRMLIRALNPAASVRNPHMLTEKIRRAEEHPEWFTGELSPGINEHEGTKPQPN